MLSPAKKIGFFWDEKQIVVIEVEKNNIIQIISHPLSVSASTESPFSSNLTKEIQIVNNIQMIVKEHRIEFNEVFLSLPVGEIILRSFVIPFVTPLELVSVVEFEAKKYVPFDIKELTYVYHSIIFIENKIRKIRVFFYAVRKEVFEKYIRVFKQAGLEIVFCEPSSMSLVKGLIFKKEIKLDQRIAFLHLQKDVGRIYFIDKGIPYFIREFSIGMVGFQEEKPVDPNTLSMKLFNEVSNSFDFYTRQFNTGKMEQMLVLASVEQEAYLDGIASDLGVQVKTFNPTVIAGASQVTDVAAVYALGVCAESASPLLSTFNFFQKKKTVSNREYL